jgi:hypothetical protein
MALRSIRGGFAGRGAMIASAAGLASLAGTALGQNRDWSNAAGGAWTTASNWTPADVPDTASENARLNLAGPYTVTLGSPISINNFEFQSAASTLNMTGATLTVGGTFNARDNLIRGNRANSTLDVAGTSTFDGTGGTTMLLGVVYIPRGIMDFRNTQPVDFCDTRVDHRNSATWTGGGSILIGLGTQWDMASGSTFDIQNDQSLQYNSMGAVPTFNNAGTIRKSAGSGTTSFDGFTFTNTGTIRVDTGTFSTNSIALVSNTLATGTWDVRNNATLTLVGQTVQTNQATVLLDGAASSFAAFNTLQTNDTAGRVTLSGGRVFTSAGAFTNAGTLNVTTGSQFVGSGTVSNTGTAALDAGTFTTAGAVTNSGTVDLKNASNFTVQAGGSLTNLAAGTLTAGTYKLDNSTLTLPSGNITTLNANVQLTGTGAIRTSGGSADALAPLATIGATGSLSIKNTGTFNTAGNFTVATGGVITVDTGSTLSVAPGATLTNFAGGVFSGGQFVVRGTVIADNLAITTLNTNFNLDSATGQLINRTTGLSAFASLATIDTAGNFGVTGGSTFSTVGNLGMNTGSTLTLGAATGTTFTVNGALNQAASSTIALTRGGSLVVTGGLNLGGNLTGSGTINGNIVNNGVISAGNSPGQLDITGDLLIQTDGGFLFELGGLTPGIGHDIVNVSGLVDFGGRPRGTATIAVLPSFFSTVDIGQRYTLLTGAFLDGTFLNIDGLSGPGYILRPWQTSTAFGVEVVIPSPGALGMAACSMLVATRRRR